jgi:hypothetical protein
VRLRKRLSPRQAGSSHLMASPSQTSGQCGADDVDTMIGDAFVRSQTTRTPTCGHRAASLVRLRAIVGVETPIRFAMQLQSTSPDIRCLRPSPLDVDQPTRR